MKNNNSLKEIGKVLLEANSIYLFPHTLMDGDALGSSIAICKNLREKGKECHILIEDPVPDYLKFLDKEYVTWNNDKIKDPDICMCVDCGDIERFPKRKDTFLRGKTKVCIDHHVTTSPFADYNYIDDEAAATGEIVFELLKAMEIEPDKETAEALFCAITTDTGNFQYSNTRKKTFEIMVSLMDADIDINTVSNAIYQNVPLEKFAITNKILDGMQIFANNGAAIAFVTQKMLAESGALMEHTEGVAATLRSIAGVEISAFLKEIEPRLVKVGMRAKSFADVAAICKKYDGGGHIKAAGCTLKMSMDEAIELMKNEIEKALKESASLKQN